LSTECFERRQAVSAPADDDDTLQDLIASLREQGERVLVDLCASAPSAQDLQQLGCDRRIVKLQGQWQLLGIQ